MVSSTFTPEQTRLDTIKHLRWQAKALANRLYTVRLLSAANQQTTLNTTTGLADELGSDLVALVRGAARAPPSPCWPSYIMPTPSSRPCSTPSPPGEKPVWRKSSRLTALSSMALAATMSGAPQSRRPRRVRPPPPARSGARPAGHRTQFRMRCEEISCDEQT